MSEYNYNDGGRKDAGFKGDAGDCVTRAIAIASGKDYQEVYDSLKEIAGQVSQGRCKVAKSLQQKGTTPRNGVNKKVYNKLLKKLGFTWKPLMGIGTGCKVHLTASELPTGTIICRLSRHLCAVVDGVVQDTHDCTRKGNRCVYGYWEKKENQQ